MGARCWASFGSSHPSVLMLYLAGIVLRTIWEIHRALTSANNIKRYLHCLQIKMTQLYGHSEFSPRHNPRIVLWIRVICPISIHITQESHWWSSSKSLRRKKKFFSTKWSSWLTFSVPHWQKSIRLRESDGDSFWIFLILYGWNLNHLSILYTEDVPIAVSEANFGPDLIGLKEIFFQNIDRFNHYLWNILGVQIV
jgi:hypothetical protein